MRHTIHSGQAKRKYRDDFDRLSVALVDYQALWRQRAFFSPETDWKPHHPALYDALCALDSDYAEQLATDNQALLAWFSPHLPQLCAQLSDISIAQNIQQSLTSNARHAVAIPGRKWQQISAFSSAIPQLHHPIVEWCAGKAHLGRTLSRKHQQPVSSLEFDPILCKAGQALADQQTLAVELIHHDVLTPLPQQVQGSELAHVGLHACGQLHIKLLQSAVSEGSRQIAISPCCYHKIAKEIYVPLSTHAQRVELTLSKNDIHLAQEETITAGKRVQHLRHKEQAWRLGFDLLQRQQQGSDSYQAIPSTPKAIFAGNFAEFCRWAASSFELTLNGSIDYAHYLALGEQRRQQVIKLDLIRQLFRRPLELWLALDRVLFLQEQGYKVSLSEFCERKTTPRNLLIYAEC